MRLKIQVPLSCKDEVIDLLRQRQAAIEEQDLAGNMFSVVCLLEPGGFRPVHSLVQSSNGRMEVVSLAAIGEEPDIKAGMEGLKLGTHQQPMVLEDMMAAASAAAAAGAPPQQNNMGATSMPGPRRVAPVSSEPSTQVVLYARGPIAELPEEHASRKERFAELDDLQPGWTVELTSRAAGAAVEAVLYAPDGQKVGTFAAARRLALANSKK